MKLRRVRVQNYRSIVDSGIVDIEKRVTVLIGKNEQGKTSFQKALQSLNNGVSYSPKDLPNHLRAGLEKTAAGQIPIVDAWFSLDESDEPKLKGVISDPQTAQDLHVTKYYSGDYSYATVKGDTSETQLVPRPPDIANFVKEIKQQAEALRAKLSTHAERLPTFAPSVEQSSTHIDALIGANFDDYERIGNLVKTFGAGMTGVPGQDAAIQEDVANTIAAITKTQTSIQNAVSHDFYAPLRAALPRFIFHSTGMDRIIGREILRCAFLACALGWQGGVPISVAQIYHVKEMNAEQIRALDRTKTVVILPGGILEEHGPYLPCFADGYMSERLTQELAEAILERKGWNVLVFPTIPLGTGGANEIGGKYSFSGTFAVRSSTLRAIFMDLASELGDQGFRWIFVIHIHGGLNHHRALDEAGEYFHDTYGGQMVPLGGLVPAQDLRSPEIREEEGFTVHADMEETSVDLFLCPRLVSPAFREARPQTGRNMDDLVGIARRNEWPGYFGSPRRASAAFGALHWRRFSSDAVGLALKILDGLDYRKLPRYWDMMRADPANVAVADAALDHEQEVERKQLEWLKKKGLR